MIPEDAGKPPVLRIGLPVPMRRSFDYLAPPDLNDEQTLRLKPGCRVEVPFGHKTLVGVLLETSRTTDIAADKLKPAKRILDDAPLIPLSLLTLIRWATDYYHHPTGDALCSTLPVLLRQGEPARTRTERWWRLTTTGKGLPEGALKRAPKQASLLACLQTAPQSAAQLNKLGFTTANIKTLKDKSLIEDYEEEIRAPSAPLDAAELLAQSPLNLNDEQQFAVGEIQPGEHFQPVLLDGVTGSGKTEVYLQVIEKALRQQQQALVLVPEIGLTPQTIERFRSRFNCNVVAFHSGLNNRERLDAWLQASRNEAAIVIGTRSAIFTPMPNLGVIIVDEEHDGSFKQQDGFRYSARDLAIVRAQQQKIPVILGTATPSLETLHNALEERYTHLRLTQRAAGAQPPAVQMIDTAGCKLVEGFSPELLEAMSEQLTQGNQVLVFLNRRGYAPVLICRDCGWIANCTFCSARTTVHKKQHLLRCHHCGFQQPLPPRCPDCGSVHLDYIGHGTQRSEELLKLRFPKTRIIRIDRDSVQGKNALESLLQDVHSGEPAILLGTQMIAKGHHFPDVTLVAILDADGGIFSADFRGAEKLAQLITQVAGRAGRAQKPGRVMIQSQFAEHPILQTLVSDSYDRLARQLLAERQTIGLPPYRYQAILRAETHDPAQGVTFLRQVRELIDGLIAQYQTVNVLGPIPSLMEKRASYYRQELIFTTTQRQPLQQLLTALIKNIEALPDSKKYRWAVDVDPI